MKQKFRMLTFVRVCKDMPSFMSHFDSDFVGIVFATYSQLHGGDDIKKYSIYKMENNKIVTKIAWYYEEQLTELSNQNRKLAEEMIEEYHLKRQS